MFSKVWVRPVFVVCLAGAVIGAIWPLTADEPALPPGVVATLKGHTETLYAIAFSPDGKHVLTGSFDKTLKLWETATGKEVKTLGGPAGHQNLILSTAFSPDGQMMASGSSDNTAKIWSIPTPSMVWRSVPMGSASPAPAKTEPLRYGQPLMRNKF